jgi:hypothetical protein
MEKAQRENPGFVLMALLIIKVQLATGKKRLI